MKKYEIKHHELQIIKIRGQLGAGNTPLNDIKKPHNMRSVVFDRRIARLIRHEAEFKGKFQAGLTEWFNSRY